MAIELHDQISGTTAEEIDLNPLLLATSSTFHDFTVSVAIGKPTTEIWAWALEVGFQDQSDQRAWAAYKKIEPRYSDANRMLAK